MPVSVRIHDPSRFIDSVDVCQETWDVVVLHIDLTGEGKRAQVLGYSGRTVILSKSNLLHGREVEIEVLGLPEHERWIIFAEVARYTLLITALRAACLEEGREVYRRVGS